TSLRTDFLVGPGSTLSFINLGSSFKQRYTFINVSFSPQVAISARAGTVNLLGQFSMRSVVRVDRYVTLNFLGGQVTGAPSADLWIRGFFYWTGGTLKRLQVIIVGDLFLGPFLFLPFSFPSLTLDSCILNILSSGVVAHNSVTLYVGPGSLITNRGH